MKPRKLIQWITIGTLLVLGFCLPWLWNSPYILHLLIVGCMTAITALSYNLLMGYAGLLSLGQAAFYAIGAYTSAIMTLKLGFPWPVGILAGALIVAIISYLMGILVLKLRGAYFAMITFGFAMLVQLGIMNWDNLTNGVYGFLRVPALFSDNKFVFVFIMGLMVVFYFIMYRIIHSQFGRILVSIREDESVALSAGVDVKRYKLIIFIISSTMTGIVGAAATHYYQYVYPSFADFTLSAGMMVQTIIGGAGYFLGPGVAAFFFTFLPEFSRAIGDYQLLIYGVILVVAIIFIPGGFEPMVRIWLSRLQNRLSFTNQKATKQTQERKQDKAI